MAAAYFAAKKSRRKLVGIGVGAAVYVALGAGLGLGHLYWKLDRTSCGVPAGRECAED